MRPRVALPRQWLDYAYHAFVENLAGITLAEALATPEGGYRSALGTIKHAAAWSHVYRSFAFDRAPTGWTALAWPRRLRDRIDMSRDYLDEVIAWFQLSHEQWTRSLGEVEEARLELPHPLHWGQAAPLRDIVVTIAGHHLSHAGEINHLLAIARGEAWEEGAEVEENHISTVGHRVVPPWRR